MQPEPPIPSPRTVKLAPLLALLLRHHRVDLTTFLDDFRETGYPEIASNLRWHSVGGSIEALKALGMWVLQFDDILGVEVQLGDVRVAERKASGTLTFRGAMPLAVRSGLPGRRLDALIDSPLFKGHPGTVVAPLGRPQQHRQMLWYEFEPTVCPL